MICPKVLIRLNPDLPVDVHPYLATGVSTSKFGVSEADLSKVLSIVKRNPRIIIVGIHIHLGSTIKDVSVFTAIHEYAKKVLARNHEHFMHVKIINVGGGLAIDYTHQGRSVKPSDLARSIPGEPEFQVLTTLFITRTLRIVKSLSGSQAFLRESDVCKFFLCVHWKKPTLKISECFMKGTLSHDR